MAYMMMNYDRNCKKSDSSERNQQEGSTHKKYKGHRSRPPRVK